MKALVDIHNELGTVKFLQLGQKCLLYNIYDNLVCWAFEHCNRDVKVFVSKVELADEKLIEHINREATVFEYFGNRKLPRATATPATPSALSQRQGGGTSGSKSARTDESRAGEGQEESRLSDVCDDIADLCGRTLDKQQIADKEQHERSCECGESGQCSRDEDGDSELLELAAKVKKQERLARIRRIVQHKQTKQLSTSVNSDETPDIGLGTYALFVGAPLVLLLVQLVVYVGWI